MAEERQNEEREAKALKDRPRRGRNAHCDQHTRPKLAPPASCVCRRRRPARFTLHACPHCACRRAMFERGCALEGAMSHEYLCSRGAVPHKKPHPTRAVTAEVWPRRARGEGPHPSRGPCDLTGASPDPSHFENRNGRFQNRPIPFSKQEWPFLKTYIWKHTPTSTEAKRHLPDGWGFPIKLTKETSTRDPQHISQVARPGGSVSPKADTQRAPKSQDMATELGRIERAPGNPAARAKELSGCPAAPAPSRPLHWCGTTGKVLSRRATPSRTRRRRRHGCTALAPYR